MITTMLLPTMLLRIIIATAIMLVALALGLWLRYLTVSRLKKTVLDNWVVQTLGVLVIIPALILGFTVVVVVSDNQEQQTILNLLHNSPLSPLMGALGPTVINNLITTIILVALGLGIARTIKALITRGMGERRVDINVRTFLGRVGYVSILTITAFWAISIWQPTTTLPVAVISVLTVAASFSFQDILKDLVAGFYLLLERPFYIGDQISVTMAPTVTHVGKVEDVQLRATKLRLITGEEVTIPNSTIFGGPVINNTFYGERRATIDVKLPHEEYSKGATTERILNILKESDKVIDKPEPLVLFNSYIAEKITLTIRFWIASGQVIDFSDIMHTLHDAFPQAELSIREPLNTV
jgi:small-conductance mechanosensitive channel